MDYYYKDGNDIDESELKRSGSWGIDQSFDRACTFLGRTYRLVLYWFGRVWIDRSGLGVGMYWSLSSARVIDR